MIALFLVYLFTIGHLGGVLLWPGVVLHAVVALLLIWTGRRARQNKARHSMSPAKSDSIGQTLRAGAALALGLALASALTSAVRAQGASPVEKAAAPAPSVAFGPAALKGTWVRPDGGYRIEIKSIGADGQIEAMYFNPNPLPFAKRQREAGR